ncbi:3-hydroxyisobutyrate dehydrogenase [Nocardiopsis metallicus]|uniref:3-hydroxyisobutyrate dehydrogenase n=1 Tax=Nocardiopsis metallicus TaxID=179819 RepID=A0A840WRC9_9ACTN|nr:3-hydroxyisobutyrate dehydrogenase [Nocardiopsis metallicus]MBB5494445.1 3-hydroxyisobutyrate dehydrogenase [Nocardiopsis metallicus]
MTAIAFVGLGNMGGPMAANLVAAGHDVTGFDLVSEALEKAAGAGVRVAGSAAEAVAEADVVITMLPSGRHLITAYQGATDSTGGGLLAAARPGTLFLDCSTVDVADARTANTAAVEAGHRAMDAPVSGGVAGAQGGTLTFMVGAEEADLATAEPLLNVMGGKVVHCGGPGGGQAAKICNNMVLGASMLAVSEAFVLGERLGLTHQALYDVMSTASGQCWSLTSYCPVPGPVPTSPANNDYKPGFAAALMAKDLGLAANALEQTGVDALIGSHAAEIYRAFADSLDGEPRDFSAIVESVRERSGQVSGPAPE